jgi:hypothetical protein
MMMMMILCVSAVFPLLPLQLSQSMQSGTELSSALLSPTYQLTERTLRTFEMNFA